MVFTKIEVEKVKNSLISSIKKRFIYLFNENLFKAITYLDPCYKNFEFVSNLTERNIIKEQAKNFIRNFSSIKIQKESSKTSTQTPLSTPLSTISQNSASSDSSSSGTESSSSRSVALNTPVTIYRKENVRTTSLIKKLQDSRRTDVAIESADLDDELKFYEIQAENFYKSFNDDDIINPLLFFKKFEINLPILSSIVKELFCLTPTSVPAESLFSVAGFIHNEERNILKSKNLEKFTFIKLNQISLNIT